MSAAIIGVAKGVQIERKCHLPLQPAKVAICLAGGHKLEPPPATTGVTPVTPEEKARAANAGKKPAVAATAAREREAEEARVQLQKAEAARDAGKEPLAEERLGRAGGGTRLTEEYFARQKTLDDAVDTARKRVEETQRDR